MQSLQVIAAGVTPSFALQDHIEGRQQAVPFSFWPHEHRARNYPITLRNVDVVKDKDSISQLHVR